MSEPREDIENVRVKDLRPGDCLPGRHGPVYVLEVVDGIANGQDSLIVKYTDGSCDTGLNARTLIRRYVV